jgi:hypothetical protein
VLNAFTWGINAVCPPSARMRELMVDIWSLFIILYTDACMLIYEDDTDDSIFRRRQNYSMHW